MDGTLFEEVGDVGGLVGSLGHLALHELVRLVVHDGDAVFEFLGGLVGFTAWEPGGEVFHCEVSMMSQCRFGKHTQRNKIHEPGAGKNHP